MPPKAGDESESWIANDGIATVKVLVVGSGAREHAIVWKLSQSPLSPELYVAPGNAGTGDLAQRVSIDASDIDGLLRFAQNDRVDLTVVGPEAPLADGIADRFQSAGQPIFGPTKKAALIESNKSFAKDLMLRHGVPTGNAEVFCSYDAAIKYVQSALAPMVVKADGLTAGKGVVVADTRDEARDALRMLMSDRRLGPAGERVLIEEYLEGEELSVFAFVDGEYVSPMVSARDYKRVGDGDGGPNTGGMGSFSPSTRWTAELDRTVRESIMEPVASALASEGSPYRGVLYAGLMLTAEGPKVIEFNCRLGDPEAQVILPRLRTDLLEVLAKTASGGLNGVTIEWDPMPCVGVVVASGGYPSSYATGYPIHGLDQVDGGVMVFHAGTTVDCAGNADQQDPITDGGRVLTVASMGRTLDEARRQAYANVERIRFQDSFYRKDVASDV